MAKLYVCGEALIDFVPYQDQDGTHAFRPKTGGSPYNAARASCLAGADVSFIGALSSDMFGEMLEADLVKAGVNCSQTLRSDDPTTLAFVDISTGSARYAFFNNGSATQNMLPQPDMISPERHDILDVGSISLIDDPGADHIADFCTAMSGKLRISLDPNARPGMTVNKAAWLNRMERISKLASIIKISDEDLDYMYPGTTAEAYAMSTLGEKTELVVVTLGSEGACAFTQQGSAQVAAPKVDVADTVGAGDAVMGAMLAWILDHCADSGTPISCLGKDQLESMLRFSTMAAAINCTRIGASPPTKAEILRQLENVG